MKGTTTVLVNGSITFYLFGPITRERVEKETRIISWRRSQLEK